MHDTQGPSQQACYRANRYTDSMLILATLLEPGPDTLLQVSGQKKFTAADAEVKWTFLGTDDLASVTYLQVHSHVPSMPL